MKKILAFTLLLTLSVMSISQQTNSSLSLTKQDYLKKSKNQKTTAWIMLASGTVLMTAGSIIWGNEVNKEVENDPFAVFYAPYTTTKGTGITVAGIVVSACSIPFFIAARKNNRKAMSLSFKNEKVTQISKQSLVYKTIPSLSLKINL